MGELLNFGAVLVLSAVVSYALHNEEAKDFRAGVKAVLADSFAMLVKVETKGCGKSDAAHFIRQHIMSFGLDTDTLVAWLDLSDQDLIAAALRTSVREKLAQFKLEVAEDKSDAGEVTVEDTPGSDAAQLDMEDAAGEPMTGWDEDRVDYSETRCMTHEPITVQCLSEMSFSITRAGVTETYQGHPVGYSKVHDVSYDSDPGGGGSTIDPHPCGEDACSIMLEANSNQARWVYMAVARTPFADLPGDPLSAVEVLNMRSNTIRWKPGQYATNPIRYIEGGIRYEIQGRVCENAEPSPTFFEALELNKWDGSSYFPILCDQVL
jgi:hypothetical protein